MFVMVTKNLTSLLVYDTM